ncbi:TPA: YmfL family putative regulatory protein, partial [Salmonella enterica]
PEWKVEKQPRWLVAAIKKTISSLHGGYEEAAEWLDVTKDALFNRLRTGGDQIFPIGWALVLQRAGGTYHLAHSVARASGGVFVPLADMEEVDNADINQRLLEAIEQITSYSQQIRVAIEDGVIEPHEKAVI